MRRLSALGEHGRPLLEGDDATGTLAGLLSQRQAAYGEAEIAINTDGREPEDIVLAIVEEIRARAMSSASPQEFERNS